MDIPPCCHLFWFCRYKVESLLVNRRYTILLLSYMIHVHWNEEEGMLMKVPAKPPLEMGTFIPDFVNDVTYSHSCVTLNLMKVSTFAVL